jgi:hypothetical protein
LQIIEQGHARQFLTFEYRDRNGDHGFRIFSREVGDGVYETGGPGIWFRVSGYDPSSNSTLVPIPDDVSIDTIDMLTRGGASEFESIRFRVEPVSNRSFRIETDFGEKVSTAGLLFEGTYRRR